MGNPAYKEANDLIIRGIAENVIDVTPKAIQRMKFGRANRFKSLMEAVRAQREQTIVDNPWLGQQSSWQLPTTRRYHQSRSPLEGPLTQPNAAFDWMAEVARFPVPFGSVGIVKSFEQYVSQGGTVLTASANWGNPYPSGLTVRWFFRLSHINAMQNAWINASGLSAVPDYLPGTAYDDFDRSVGLWFPASSSSSANIHLAIPGGQVLRVLALIGQNQTVHQVAAKITGTIQIETNAEAQSVVRTTW